MHGINLLVAMERVPRRGMAVLSVLSVGLLGYLDYVSGKDLSVLLFYVIPIFLASWYVGQRAGLVISAMCGVAWLYANVLAYDSRLQEGIYYWNASMRFGFLVLVGGVISSLRRSIDAERRLSRVDQLTGAVNRRHFLELGEVEIERARRHGWPLSIAFVDLDNFKAVNDKQGHGEGDRALRSVVDTIRAHARTVDHVARLGGDEFAVLLPEAGEEAVRLAMERILDVLDEQMKTHAWPITFSVGMLTFPVPPASAEDMIREADALMYEAKRGGKNTMLHRVAGAGGTGPAR